jgi:hypothetical protein
VLALGRHLVRREHDAARITGGHAVRRAGLRASASSR